MLGLCAWVVALAPAPVPVAADGPPTAVGPDRRVERSAQSRSARLQRRRRRLQRRPRGYRAMRARWHRRAPRGMVREWLEAEPPPLVLRPVGTRDRHELTPASDEGGFDEEDLAIAREAFMDDDTETTHAIHPRLLAIMYRAVRRFDAPWVHVVSGFRVTRATSRHNQGRAIDLVLPGVGDRRLARFLMRQGFVGVGIYPVSGFVHLDVREESHFWVDYSGPGQRPRERPVMRRHVARFDARARERGVEPVRDIEAPDSAVAGAWQDAIPMPGGSG